MALPSYTQMAEARWIAYYLREGFDPLEVEERFRRRFPDLPVGRYEIASQFARTMLRVGAKVAALQPEQQIKAALGRLKQPDPRVSVSVLYHWTDADGRDYWNTIKVAAHWEDTVADVLARARATLSDIMGRYPGATEAGWEIIPSVLWPSGEQL